MDSHLIPIVEIGVEVGEKRSVKLPLNQGAVILDVGQGFRGDLSASLFDVSQSGDDIFSLDGTEGFVTEIPFIKRQIKQISAPDEGNGDEGVENLDFLQDRED